MANVTKQGGTPVNLRDRVEMTATEKHPTYKAGVHFKVHREQVKKLTEQGWAVEGHVSVEPAKAAKPAAATKEK